MNIQEQIAELKDKLAKLEEQVNKPNEINSVEDAYNLLKPKFWLGNDGRIHKDNDPQCYDFESSVLNMTSEKRAKQIKALIQLNLIAEAMNKLVEINEGEFYHVTSGFLIFYISEKSSLGIIGPVFNTKELAKEALEKFKDLFKDLYMLND